MRRETNRLGEMDMFVQVVEQGGLSAAARHRRMSPSAVSKLVTRLEERLGARLINRSTRQFQLTPEGAAFYRRAVAILSDLDEAERSAAGGERAAGRIAVSSSATFANHLLYPRLGLFRTRHPDVTLDIALTDRLVDLLQERTDVAVRAGPLKSSSLIARKLGATRKVIVASPDYLSARGHPCDPADLHGHVRLEHSYVRTVEGWPLLGKEGPVTVPASGEIVASDGEALRHLALAGVGLVRLPLFAVAEDVRVGRLMPVLEDFNPGDREEFHAVYLGQGGLLPARIRAFLDFLAETVRMTETLSSP